VTEDRQPVKYEQGSGYGYSQLFIGEQNVPFDSGKHRFVIHYMVDSRSIWAGRATRSIGMPTATDMKPRSKRLFSPSFAVGDPEEDIEVEPRVAGRGVSSPRRPETALDRLDHGNGPLSIAQPKSGPAKV